MRFNLKKRVHEASTRAAVASANARLAHALQKGTSDAPLLALIQSKSRKTVKHEIRVKGLELTCSCEAFRYSKHDAACPHLRTFLAKVRPITL